MKTRVASLGLVVVLFAVCLSDISAWDREYKEGFALLKAIEFTNLVVVGRVSGKECVFPENITGKFTTDITIDVDEVIKGNPNAAQIVLNS